MFSSLFQSAATTLRSGQYQIQVNQQTLHYQLKVSHRRRTLQIKVSPNGVVIYCPSFINHEQLTSFIKDKYLWIIDHQQQFSGVAQFNYQHGQVIYLFGEPHKLQLSRGTRLHWEVQQDELSVIIPKRVKDSRAYVKNVLKTIYLELTQRYFEKNQQQLENKTGLFSNSLTFKFYKRRWGSCDSKNNITINPLLIGAPEWVINCVYIHELCHIKHLNHGAEFKRLNDKLCGQCVQADHWLRQNQHLLVLP